MHDGETSVSDASISFAIASIHGNHIEKLLGVVEDALRPDDEIVLLLRDGHSLRFAERRSRPRVVSIPDATIFHLRSQIPVACRKPWIVLLEDHSLLDRAAIDAIRRRIRERPDINLIPFLAKVLTSRGTWDWPIFLYTFAPVWAPLEKPPPFAPVTSAVIRRSYLGNAPLRDGEWELVTIPQAFATTKWSYSNDIFIDHVKPMGMVEALRIVFHNARAGAAFQRQFGHSAEHVQREGWYAFVARPAELICAAASRSDEIPAGTKARLHALGFAHLIGNLAALAFGGGQAAQHVD